MFTQVYAPLLLLLLFLLLLLLLLQRHCDFCLSFYVCMGLQLLLLFPNFPIPISACDFIYMYARVHMFTPLFLFQLHSSLCLLYMYTFTHVYILLFLFHRSTFLSLSFYTCVYTGLHWCPTFPAKFLFLCEFLYTRLHTFTSLSFSRYIPVSV